MVIQNNNLDIEQAAQSFAALGSTARMQIVLVLVARGKAGLSIGEIQSRTSIAPSTLAHHLRFLREAGLIEQEKSGRTIINRAAFDRLEQLAGFILKQCCIEEQSAPEQKCQNSLVPCFGCAT